MEAIWEDLSKIDSEIDSPGWHGKALEETKDRVTSRVEQITDWESAKQELRKRFE